MKGSPPKTAPWLLVGLLLAALGAQTDIPCVWTGVERVVAVGDLHGDYANFSSILKRTEMVDADLHWAAGRTHLVQTGDILDRGPEARRILDLLMRLEKEAEEAGGRVHCLIGNHEEMNISGIAFDYPGYITLEQFLSFLPEDYQEEREKELLRQWRILHPAGGDRTVIPAETRRRFWQELLDREQEARTRYLDFFRSRYGRWIAGHNAIVKINETIFSHGGISHEYSLKPLPQINGDLRQELLALIDGRDFTPRMLYARDGPLWNRDLALQEEAVYEDEVDSILANLQAKQMVIGHTVLGLATRNSMRRFEGKVWIIDTGISSVYGGRLSALIIEGGAFKPWGDGL